MITNPGSKILYGVATGLEKAMADADIERLIALNAEAVQDVWNPDTIPIALLPYLAYSMGVELWNNGWTETTKREWVKRQWEFKALRGTRAGLEMAVDFAGRDTSPFGWKVKEVITQPQGFYASAPMTPEDYQAWLDSLPEIRLFRMHSFGAAMNVAAAPPAMINYQMEPGGLHFAAYEDRALVDDLCMYAGPGIVAEDDDVYVGIVAGDPLTLQDVSMRKAVLIENGVETSLSIDNEASVDKLEVETFYIKHNEHFFYAGAYADNNFAPPDDEQIDYITAIKRDGDLPWWNVSHSGAEPVKSNPVLRTLTEPDTAHVYAGGLPTGMFASAPYNNDHLVFESWRLAARGRLPERNNVASYADISKVGWPDFTVETTIDISERGVLGYAFADLPSTTYFASAPNDKPLNLLWQAINASRALRDRVLVDTGANRPLTIESPNVSFDDLTL